MHRDHRGKNASKPGHFAILGALLGFRELPPKTVDTTSESRNMSTATAPVKRRRADHPKAANLCEHCVAKCCRYFALPIDEPASRKDFDFIRWYLLHDRASIFVDDDTWYLLVHTACKHLQSDYRCGIYETRPQICREYTTEACEFEDDWCYDKYFETPEQIDEYADALYGPQFPPPNASAREAIRSRRPTGLPMVS